ncbi:UDP:flavonoid glycosyltransferase YjiC (YdhE family) [Streptomyces umbrinus]|uniref:UDP:flavonoid glycosyltransferase YjiC (YdhE family) n=1 Tax=Streptomyces umbrinus TaxID=67370 RepID=A0ABU0SNN1_9ACTN|nr:nucleotide disphospho-sugar-binding domain-containing protein [Streptomyces umbrinus]MDQ1025092.1 UDP:flavonoid glycosyltransferase YjiC (YdhE family) [Streptomyces umbrinus]
MTPKHIAIFVFPGYGQANPTLEISRLLMTLGHRVTYVLDERLAPPVWAAGADIGGYTSRRGRLGTENVSGEYIGALGLAFLQESMEVILPRTLEALDGDVPDLILYDLESFFTAHTAAKLWGRPTAQLFPYVATTEEYSRALEVFAGADEDRRKCIDLVTEYLTGEDPDTVWSFMADFDERNLVLLPREFQPLGETLDQRYTFTGHSRPAGRSGPGSWSRPDFFETCGAAFADGDWHLVLTVGPHNLEALYFSKPLVVVTCTPEDRVNSRRITELGPGVELPSEEVTAERLRAAVESVANDPRIRRQLARMRMDMLAAGGPARAAQLIDGRLNEPFPTSGEPMKDTALSAAPESAGAR